MPACQFGIIRPCTLSLTDAKLFVEEAPFHLNKTADESAQYTTKSQAGECTASKDCYQELYSAQTKHIFSTHWKCKQQQAIVAVNRMKVSLHTIHLM